MAARFFAALEAEVTAAESDRPPNSVPPIESVWEFRLQAIPFSK